MSAKFGYVLMTLSAVSLSGSACAMNSPSSQLVDCSVLGADKLPAEVGGSDALCAAIARAAAATAPSRRFSVEVRVLGSSSLSATVTTADGTKLPEQKFAISDRNLSRRSIDRFATALAGEVAQASPR